MRDKLRKKNFNEKGITLIALIITIIIMLILVAVTIDIAVDGKLFEKAQEAVDKTNDKVGATQDRIDEWMGKLDKEPEEEQVPEPEEPVIVEPEKIEDWEYEPEDDGTLRITGYLGSDTDVVVPNSIDGVPVSIVGRINPNISSMRGEASIWDSTICDTYIGIGASKTIYSNESIKSVEVSPGIVEIGDYAFAGSLGMERCVIPSSVEYIGEKAFYECRELASIEIPEGITEIADGTFSRCGSLTEIAIPDGVTTIGGYAFWECESLERIAIPDGVATIGIWAFSLCYSLEEITIPNSVTTVEDGVFTNCTVTVNVPWKEGQKPDGWSDAWDLDGEITVNYAQ